MAQVLMVCRESKRKPRSPLLFLVFLFVGTLFGCNAHIHTPYQSEMSTRSEQQSRAPILAYEKGPVPFENTILQQDPEFTYQVRRLRIPSINDNGQKSKIIEAIYYRSNTAGKLPLVIVLPIWDDLLRYEHTYPPRKMTSTFRLRSHGVMHILRVLGENETYEIDEVGEAETKEQFLSKMAHVAQQEATNVVDISRLVDWAEARKEIDAARIGLIGFSRSAVTAGMVAVNEPRFAAIVLVMGGAHPHRIMATCDGDVGRPRDKILQRFGWTASDYQQAIEPFFRPIDAANYPGRSDPSRILIFDSHEDECIPRDARDDLWEALGRPERISFLYGHNKSFLSMTPLGLNWMRREIYEFFEDTLNLGFDPAAQSQVDARKGQGN